MEAENRVTMMPEYGCKIIYVQQELSQGNEAVPSSIMLCARHIEHRQSPMKELAAMALAEGGQK